MWLAWLVLALAVDSMALLVKRGDFQITTGIVGTVIQVRSVGFTPKAVLFWWNGRDSAVDASGEASYQAGFGWGISTSERRCTGAHSLHGAANSSAIGYRTANACIVTELAGTVDGLADYNGAVSDGFDIIIDDVFATAFRVHYLALGGADLTDVATGTIMSPSVLGPLDVDCGFEPDCLITLPFGTVAQAPEDTDTGFAPMVVGVATGIGATEQFVCASGAQDTQAASKVRNWCRSGRNIMSWNGSLIAEEGTLAAWLPEGFRLNYTVGTSRQAYYLALKGPRFVVRNFATSTTGAASIPVTGAGFAPKAVMFFSANRAEDGAAASLPQAMSIGVATGTGAGEQAAVLFAEKDSSATMDVFTALDYDKVYINADEAATQAVEGLMALTSLDADGFTCVQSDADPVASFVGSLCLGDAAIGGEEDESGLIYRGTPIRYVDSDNNDMGAYLESAQAAYGDTVDLAVLRVSGSTLVKVSVTSVPHYFGSGVAPYWLRY